MANQCKCFGTEKQGGLTAHKQFSGIVVEYRYLNTTHWEAIHGSSNMCIILLLIFLLWNYCSNCRESVNLNDWLPNLNNYVSRSFCYYD